jgi:hypothetical protein
VALAYNDIGLLEREREKQSNALTHQEIIVSRIMCIRFNHALLLNNYTAR